MTDSITIQDFKISKVINGILVDALDYHTKPCLIDNDFLRILGYHELKDQDIFDLIELLKNILKSLEHNTVQPKLNHTCGSPNAMCDSDCVAAAYDSELITKTNFAIKFLEKLNFSR